MTMRFVGAERTRHAAVAGLFYPSDAQALSDGVRRLLGRVPDANAGRTPKALIVPHAGYIYSGPVAAHAYALLRAPSAAKIRRIVLVGPAHHADVRGFALPDVDGFETPIGVVPVDAEAIDRVAALPHTSFDNVAHAPEHALEVQLPFLQSVLDDFTVVPIAVGRATGDDVAALLESVFGGDETLVIVSSDLSHYHRYRDAQARDRVTVDAIVAGARDVDPDEACGATPINGLMRTARAHHLVPRLLDCRNSGDTGGDRSRVVGYAALAYDVASADTDGASGG